MFFFCNSNIEEFYKISFENAEKFLAFDKRRNIFLEAKLDDDGTLGFVRVPLRFVL